MKSESKWLNGNTMSVFVVTMFGFAGIFFHSLQFLSTSCKFFSVLGTGLMIAAALVIAGIFVGFLFGIPKSFSSNHHDPSADNKSGNGDVTHSTLYHANTNLEQISDWLTKILVGVGLTQLIHLPSYLKSASVHIAEGLGGKDAQIFACAVLVYFSVCGFLLGYLWTRLLVADALQKADTGFHDFLHGLMRTIAEIEVRIETGQDVSAKKEIQTIRRIVEQAFGSYSQDSGQVRKKLEELAKNFEKLSFELMDDYKHSTKVSGIIVQARALACQANLTEKEIDDRIVNGSSDGERIVNIGLLYIVKAKKGFDYLLELIDKPKSPFEQYHAMLLAEHMAYGLDEEQRKKLEDVLNTQRYLTQKTSGGRWLIKNRILKKINEKYLVCIDNSINNLDDNEGHV